MIAGIQKLSLVDYKEEISATLFTKGCNFNCPFCHNSMFIGVDEPDISDDDVISFLEKKKGVLTAVCITGGEPTLWGDKLYNLIKRIKDLGYKVKLDTNGTNPKLLKRLFEDGLIDYAALDFKATFENYHKVIGKQMDLSRVKESFEFLFASNYSYELRTTLISEIHTKEEIEKMVKEIKGCKNYYLQKFENSENVRDKSLTGIKKEDALSLRDIFRNNNINCELRNY